MPHGGEGRKEEHRRRHVVRGWRRDPEWPTEEGKAVGAVQKESNVGLGLKKGHSTVNEKYGKQSVSKNTSHVP